MGVGFHSFLLLHHELWKLWIMGSDYSSWTFVSNAAELSFCYGSLVFSGNPRCKTRNPISPNRSALVCLLYRPPLASSNCRFPFPINWKGEWSYLTLHLTAGAEERPNNRPPRNPRPNSRCHVRQVDLFHFHPTSCSLSGADELYEIIRWVRRVFAAAFLFLLSGWRWLRVSSLHARLGAMTVRGFNKPWDVAP